MTRLSLIVKTQARTGEAESSPFSFHGVGSWPSINLNYQQEAILRKLPKLALASVHQIKLGGRGDFKDLGSLSSSALLRNNKLIIDGEVLFAAGVEPRAPIS